MGISTLIGVSNFVTTSGGTDTDAVAFLTATGITDPTISSAINTLVVNAKANGWWTLCTAIYPFVGGTSTTCKYNLKDPRDLDAAFRLTFTSSPSFASTGITFNGSNYANTILTPSTTLSLNSTHISLYSRTSTSYGGGSGIYDISNNAVTVIYRRYSDDIFYAGVNQASEEFIASNTDGSGWYLASRIGASSQVFAKNNTTYTNTTSSNTLSAFTLKIGANDTDFDNAEYAFATVGVGINTTIAGLMYADIQAFQTALSRQV